MLELKKWIINTLTNDSTMQSLLGATSSSMPIFPVDADVQPEVSPSITYQDIGNTALTVPQGVHIGIIQFDIWSFYNSLEVETIYERMDQLLNFKDSTTQTISGKLFWIRESGARDLHSGSPNRRIWRKQVDYKFWTSRTDNS